ncbi:MAG: hypothetical protein IJL56_08510 [Bacteroidales bacterium]|nr:hypothetical protein [Bacteroidales bacterium]
MRASLLLKSLIVSMVLWAAIPQNGFSFNNGFSMSSSISEEIIVSTRERCAANNVVSNSIAPQNHNNPNTYLPTAKEIEAINENLPTMVADGLMFTKIEYYPKSKTLCYFFRYTKEPSRQSTSPSYINNNKKFLAASLRNDPIGSIRISRAGMTYKYRYYSKDNKFLYEFKIDKTDF